MRALGIADDSLRPFVKKYARFFNEKNRFASFRSFQVDKYTEDIIDRTVLAVLTRSSFNTLDDITRSLLMNALDERNVLWENIEKYGDVETLWQLVERYYGYPLKERSMSSLLIYFLLASLSEQVPGITLPERWQKYVRTAR